VAREREEDAFISLADKERGKEGKNTSGPHCRPPPRKGGERAKKVSLSLIPRPELFEKEKKKRSLGGVTHSQLGREGKRTSNLSNGE